MRYLLLAMVLVSVLLYVLRRLGAPLLMVAAGIFIWLFVFVGNARYTVLFEQQRDLPALIEMAAPRNVADVFERLSVPGGPRTPLQMPHCFSN